MKEVKRGEMYYADMNPVFGYEQGGIRPVLIIQNDTGNKFSPTTIAAITSQNKSNMPTHVKIHTAALSKASVVLLEHIRSIDKRRLMEYIGMLDEESMSRVDRAIAVSFGISYLEGLK